MNESRRTQATIPDRCRPSFRTTTGRVEIPNFIFSCIFFSLDWFCSPISVLVEMFVTQSFLSFRLGPSNQQNSSPSQRLAFFFPWVSKTQPFVRSFWHFLFLGHRFFFFESTQLAWSFWFLVFGFGLICRHKASNSIASETHTSGVCCFVSSNRYWGIVTVPESFLCRGPGVAGSSPSTLTTSLVTPVSSSPSSNGPITTSLTTRGLCPGGSVVWADPKFVRPHWWES